MRQTWIILAFSVAAYCYSSPYECSPKKIEKLLKQIPSWNFDITELANARGNRAYHAVAAYVTEQLFPVTDIIRLKKKKEIKILRNVINDLSKQFNNIFHNSLHAADVLQAVAVILPNARNYLSSFDTVSLILAALSIGAGRPIFSSSFYNSPEVLSENRNLRLIPESMNAATALRIMKEAGLFSKVSHDYSYRDLEKRISDLIVATNHDEHYIDTFNLYVANKTTLSPPEAGRLISIMILKVAVFSNVARPFPLAYEWAQKYVEEQFRQSDFEMATGKTPTTLVRNKLKFPDREIRIIKSRLDAFRSFSNYFNTPFLVANMEINIEKWQRLSNQWNVPTDNFFLQGKI